MCKLMQTYQQDDLKSSAQTYARNHRYELEKVPNILYKVHFCAPGLYSDSQAKDQPDGADK